MRILSGSQVPSVVEKGAGEVPTVRLKTVLASRQTQGRSRRRGSTYPTLFSDFMNDYVWSLLLERDVRQVNKESYRQK